MNTIHRQYHLKWTLECGLSFAKITEAPVLRQFDPSLRTAVHVDGSQNAVGAVLLQWQENKDNLHPVALMSRKLFGPQYRYDARNVEALAAQMALITWHTLLLGVKLEISSVSLQYLFTRKSPVCSICLR